MPATPLDRRLLLLTGTSLLLAGCAPRAAAAEMTVYRDPSCGCCGDWVAHMKAAGFDAKIVDSTDLASVRARLGVPEVLSSCHTAEVGGYAIEGHVPASDVRKLLAQRPKAAGLAVPGMKTGSPGMTVPSGEHEPYDVLLFGADTRSVFASYR